MTTYPRPTRDPSTRGQTLAAYARLSYNPDGTKHSVDRQKAEMSAYAEKRGLTITEWYSDDGKSAWKTGVWRQGWEDLMAALAAGKHGGVLCAHMDRMTRNGRDTLRLLEAGAVHELLLHATAGQSFDLSNSEDRFLCEMLALVARKQSDDTSRRLAGAMRERREAGIVDMVGYGWRRRDDGTVEQEPGEAAILREIAAGLLAGKPWFDVLGPIAERGVRTHAGRKIDPSTARRALLAPRTVGKIVWNGEVIGRHDGVPILTEEAQDRLRADWASRHHQPRATHLLSGLIECGRPGCGGRMIGARQQKRGRDGEVYGYRLRYLCQGRDGPGLSKCGNTISGAPLEAAVEAAVLEWQKANRAGDLAYTSGVINEAHAKLSAALEEELQRAGKLTERWTARHLSDADYDRLTAALGAEIDRLRRELAELDTEAGTALRSAELAAAAYADAGLATKRAMIAQAVRITVNPASRITRGVDLSRVKIEPRQ